MTPPEAILHYNQAREYTHDALKDLDRRDNYFSIQNLRNAKYNLIHALGQLSLILADDPASNG